MNEVLNDTSANKLACPANGINCIRCFGIAATTMCDGLKDFGMSEDVAKAIQEKSAIGAVVAQQGVDVLSCHARKERARIIGKQLAIAYQNGIVTDQNI